MFLDNSPCHPPSLKGMFFNIQIEFLPKNTTSRTRPLDAGIIKTWKLHYRKKVLRYVAGQIVGTAAVSDIIKSVNLLLAIRWMVGAWGGSEAEGRKEGLQARWHVSRKTGRCT